MWKFKHEGKIDSMLSSALINPSLKSGCCPVLMKLLGSYHLSPVAGFLSSLQTSLSPHKHAHTQVYDNEEAQGAGGAGAIFSIIQAKLSGRSGGAAAVVVQACVSVCVNVRTAPVVPRLLRDYIFQTSGVTGEKCAR